MTTTCVVNDSDDVSRSDADDGPKSNIVQSDDNGGKSADDTTHSHSRIHSNYFEQCRLQESDATFCAGESVPAENRPELTTRNRPDPSLTSVKLRMPGGRIGCLGDLLIRQGRRYRRSRLAATRTPLAAKAGYGAKRKGAKAVKRIERERVAY